MTGPTLLQQAGSRAENATRYAPIFANRFFTGLWTQRNPLRDPSQVAFERWYGGRPDALIDGVNVELTNRLTLARRPGLLPFSTATLPAAANRFYEFRQFTGSTENITLFADTAAVIYTFTPTTVTSSFTKAAGAGAATFLGVGNVLYMGDGVEQKALRGGVWQNAGIAQLTSSGSVSANTTSAVDGGGSFAWTNPSNVQGAGPPPPYATNTVSGTNFVPSNALNCTAYGFSVGAAAAINGIKVSVTGHCVVTSGNVFQIQAQLLINGVPSGTVLQALCPVGSDGTVTFGGAGTFWGLTLTPALINTANFGVQIICTGQNHTGLRPVNVTFSLGAPVQITVFEAGPLVPVVSSSAGSFSATKGYEYVAAYSNGQGGFSQASTPSGSTGAFTNKLNVGIPVSASTDPQVTQIWVFRTSDGGGTFQALPTNPFPNTTATITDANPDSTLNEFELADITGLNTPVPVGAIAPAFHMGRIWWAVGNTVYFSSGPDMGNVLGDGTGVPPANSFPFPSLVTRLTPMPGSAGLLLVHTVSDIYAIQGQTSAAGAAAAGGALTPFWSGPFLQKIGLLSYDGVAVNGSVIYQGTADGQLLSIDPSSGVSEIGFPIAAPSAGAPPTQQTLANFPPQTIRLAWHVSGSSDKALYVADGSTGWFRCNTSQAPDGGFVWSPKAAITGGCQAVQSVEVSPGVFKLLVGPTAAGPILMRDLGTFSDNGTAYADSHFDMGSIVLAQHGQMAEIDFVALDAVQVGTVPDIQVLLDEISGQFSDLGAVNVNDPPEIYGNGPGPATIYVPRGYMSQTQAPAVCRHLQVRVAFAPTDTVQNEVLAFGIFGAHIQRK